MFEDNFYSIFIFFYPHPLTHISNSALTPYAAKSVNLIDNYIDSRKLFDVSMEFYCLFQWYHICTCVKQGCKSLNLSKPMLW